MNFEEKLDIVFNPPNADHIEEGTILPVDKIVSNAIGIPSGDYIVASVTSDKCTLVPTNEAGKTNPFEVHRPTLAGFFNPEVHTRTIDNTSDYLAD